MIPPRSSSKDLYAATPPLPLPVQGLNSPLTPSSPMHMQMQLPAPQQLAIMQQQQQQMYAQIQQQQQYQLQPHNTPYQPLSRSTTITSVSSLPAQAGPTPMIAPRKSSRVVGLTGAYNNPNSSGLQALPRSGSVTSIPDSFYQGGQGAGSFPQPSPPPPPMMPSMTPSPMPTPSPQGIYHQYQQNLPYHPQHQQQQPSSMPYKQQFIYSGPPPSHPPGHLPSPSPSPAPSRQPPPPSDGLPSPRSSFGSATDAGLHNHLPGSQPPLMTAIEGGGLAAPGADEPPPEYTTMPRGLSVNRGDLGGAGEMLQRATSFARDVASPYTRDGITLYPGGPHQQQQREAGTLPDKRSLDLQRVPPPPPSWSAPLEAPQVERTVTQSSSAGVERMLSRTGVDRLETVRTSNSGVVISNNGFIDGAREADKAGEVVEEPEGIEGSDRRDDEAPVEENSAGAGDADARSAGESPGELNTSAVVLADMSRSNSKKSLNSADSQGSTAVNSATLEEEPQKAAVALAVDVQRELPAAPKPTSVSVAPEILTEQLIDVDRELPPTPVPVDVPAAPVVVRNGSSEGQQIASKPLHERPKDLRPNVGGLAMTRSPTVSSSPHRNSEESITAGPTRPRANSDGSSLRTPGMPFQASAVEIDYRGLPPRSGRRSMGTGLIASGVGPALAIPSPPPTHKGDPRLRGSVNGTSSMSQSPPTVYYTGPPPPSPRLQQPAPFFSQSSPTPRDARDPITPTTPTGGAPPRPPLLHESDHKVAQRQAWERYKENMRRQRGEPPPPSPSQQIYAPQLPAPASPRSSIHSSTMSSQASGRSRTFSGGEGYPSPPRSMSGQRHERYGSDDRNNHYPPQAPSPHPLAPPLPPSSLSDGRRPSSPYDRGSTPTATSFPSPPPLSTSSLSPPIHHPFVPSGLGAVVPVAGAWGWSIDTLAVAVPRSSVPARSPPTSDAAAALETEMRMKGVVAEAGVDRPELDAIVSRAAREAWDRECRHGDGRAVGLRSWYAVAGEVLRDGGNRAPVGMSRVLWTGRTTDEAEMYRMLVGRHLVFPQTLARRTAPADAGSEASDDEDDEDVVEDEEKTPAGCPRCGSGCLETPRHVLLMCPTARHLWKRVSRMMERATGMEVGRVTLADVVTGFGRLKSLVETREEAVDEDDDAEDDNERVRARAANQVADVTRVVTSLHAIALHSLVSSRVYPWAGEGCAFMIFRARLASRVAVEADEEEGGEVERAAGCERLEMAVWRALRLDGVGPRRLMGTRTAFGRPAIAAPVVATVDA